MRMARLKGHADEPAAYYHCVSRVVERRFAFGDAEKEKFVKIMRGYEDFCGVRIVTFCAMSNHFHALVEVPRRPPPELLPSDAELVRRIRAIDCPHVAATVEHDLALFRLAGDHQAAEELRGKFFRRMWDISWYMRLLKQRVTQWINSRNGRTGTLWEGRFRSVLVEANGSILATMAAYIDLNPIRAGIVDDPKDYRWSGYGQAAAGGKLSREGLATAISFRLPNPSQEKVSPGRALDAYRSYLYESGQARSAGPDGTKARRGFTPEEIAKVHAKGGKLTLKEVLLCRVRYFTAGAAIGSRAFIERVFQNHRNGFGAKRDTGARPMRGINARGVFVVRALRLRPLG